MKRIVPSLYQDKVDQVVRADGSKFLILGGRCLGRTSVLRRIAEMLELEGVETRWLNDETLPSKALAAWAKEPTGVLLIDDLDTLWSQDGNAYETALASLPEDPEAEWRIVASVCHYEAMIEHKEWSGSKSLNGFRWIYLDPWFRSNQGRGPILDAMGQLSRWIGRNRPDCRHPVLTGSNPALREAWVEAILDVSDGQPTLLGAAFDGLARLVLSQEKLEEATLRLLAVPQNNQDEWLDNLRQFLEDQVLEHDQGMGKIEIAIQHYRRSSPHFDLLVDLAKYPEGIKIQGGLVRKSLKSSGLVYRDPTSGRLKVAGALVRERLLEIAMNHPLRVVEEPSENPSKDPGSGGSTGGSKLEEAVPLTRDLRSVVIEETHGGEKPAGRVRTSGASDHEPLVISGSEWKLLATLDARPVGAVTSVQDLCKLAGLKSEGAVRSAMQRLRKKLRDNGLGDLVQNNRGRGFCLSRHSADPADEKSS